MADGLAHELADCLWLILRLSDVCEIDLSDSLREKLDLAARSKSVGVRRFGRLGRFRSSSSAGAEPAGRRLPGTGASRRLEREREAHDRRGLQGARGPAGDPGPAAAAAEHQRAGVGATQIAHHRSPRLV